VYLKLATTNCNIEWKRREMVAEMQLEIPGKIREKPSLGVREIEQVASEPKNYWLLNFAHGWGDLGQNENLPHGLRL